MSAAETARVSAYLEQLERLPFVRDARLAAAGRGRGATDARVRLSTPTVALDVPYALARTHLTREAAERMIQLAAARPGLLVMAPSVGRDLAELLARNGVQYVDLGGNCYVRVRDRYIASIQGRRAETPPSTERALRAPAYRVLLALLVDEALLNASARTLAAAAGGVSPQTANDVRARLVARGELVEARGRRGWSLDGRVQALEALVAGRAVWWTGLEIGRFRARQTRAEDVESELERRLGALGEWRWGGGAAARRLTGLYRGDRTLVYVQTATPKLLRGLPLVPASDGPVVLARAPAQVAFAGPDGCVHPVLVYADLLAEGHDRAREAAAEVHRRFLERAE